MLTSRHHIMQGSPSSSLTSTSIGFQSASYTLNASDYCAGDQSMSTNSESMPMNSSFDGSSCSSWTSPKSSHQDRQRSREQWDQQHKIRTVRLKRPTAANQSRNVLLETGVLGALATSTDQLFGFSLRGGNEFRTGFFVSHVDRKSEADLRGLCVGDQIIRVQGMIVDDATHKELTQFISKQSHLTLRVRNMGMVPVKNRDGDALTWQMVQQDQKSTSSSDYEEIPFMTDMKVNLTIGPKQKLGLGICKGPEWKPGIFVQFTKDQGIARMAGLKPGDQILSCNGVDFINIFFNDAVTIMKGSNRLELLIRTKAGLELFPGESSGYNSSASSITGGDQSPCWHEASQHANSDVTKPNATIHNKMKSPFKSKHSLERFNRDKLTVVNTPRIPISNPSAAGYQCINTLSRQATPNSVKVERDNKLVGDDNKGSSSNTTIIRLSENGTIINNTLVPTMMDYVSPSKPKTRSTTLVRVASLDSILDRSDTCLSKENVKKLVTVEVHRPEEKAKGIPPPPPPLRDPSTQSTVRSSSQVANNGLSTLGEEIRKRAMKLNSASEAKVQTIEERIRAQSKKVDPVVNDQRHTQLMDEFKVAHMKMFTRNKNSSEERQRAIELRQSADSERSRVKANGTVTAKDEENAQVMAKVVKVRNDSPKTPSPPPPPPPLQFADDVPKVTTGKMAQMELMEKPSSPTPDYDSFVADVEEEKSAHSFVSIPTPPAPPPPPPANNVKQNGQIVKNGGHKSASRPISVTIGEYGDRNHRKAPAKFPFLPKNEAVAASGRPANGHQNNLNNGTNDFRNELQMTLSRSNLRKATEAIESGSANGHGSRQLVVNGTTNGATAKPTANQIRPILQKTGSANVEKLNSMLNARIGGMISSNNNGPNGTSNKVTISIPKVNGQDQGNPVPPTNGILKNGTEELNGSNGMNGESKNISFDNIATVIQTSK